MTSNHAFRLPVTFIVLCFFLRAHAQVTDISHWENIADPQFYSTLRYPPDWKVNYIGGGYTITSPKENDTDAYQENVSFFAMEVSDTIMNGNIKNFAEANFMAMKKSLQDVRVMVNKDITKQPNMPMYLVVYNGLANGQYLYWKQVFCLYQNVAYIITYTGEAGRKDPFAIAGGDVLSSFAPLSTKRW